MPNYWIFVVTDAKIGNTEKKGIEIYNQRMSDFFWGIGDACMQRASPIPRKARKGKITTNPPHENRKYP